MSSCKDPVVPKPPPPKVEDYPSDRYVYDMEKEVYRNWDYQGSVSYNARYCHGMVAASFGIGPGNKYNHKPMDGYFDCDSSLAKGLDKPWGIDDIKNPTRVHCWCNPNYNWADYKYSDKPALGFIDAAYEGWDRQA